MVQQKESVVTRRAVRPGHPPTQDYVARIERNQKRFEENYAGTTVSPEDTAALKELMAKPNGPAKLLVIGEDWCPDVFRGMPVFQRIAEADRPRDARLQARREQGHHAEFLNNGEFESIPVAVFYTKDMDYIPHFIERPANANAEMRETSRRCTRACASPT